MRDLESQIRCSVLALEGLQVPSRVEDYHGQRREPEFVALCQGRRNDRAGGGEIDDGHLLLHALGPRGLLQRSDVAYR